jgi:homoprotocatechuate degradation regulator HpaR
MEPSMHHFRSSLPMMLYRALDAVMPRFREAFRSFDLTEQQWRVLRVLWEHDEIAFRRLAEITLIPAPSLVGVVDRLQTRNLVRRRRDESDRRNVYVSATREGDDLREKVMPLVDETYEEIRRSIDDQTWARLMDGLECVSAIGNGKAHDSKSDDYEGGTNNG